MVKLSPKQKEVLTLISEGYPNKEIADAMGIKTNTVKKHVEMCMDRLDVRPPTRTRVGLVYKAWKLGLITVVLTTMAFANTPGKHQVALSWLDSDPTAISYNIYKGITSGVCGTGGTVTPYVVFWPTKTYVDVNVAAGQTPIYAVSAVNGAGGESNCTPELQVTVPSAPQAPTGLQGTAN